MRVKRNSVDYNAIKSFVGHYSYLSPFNKKSVKFNHVLYPSIIHAYFGEISPLRIRHFIKTKNLNNKAPTAFVKEVLKAYPVHEGVSYSTSDSDVEVMRSILTAYFSQNADLSAKLSRTGDRTILFADDTVFDTVLGVKAGTGTSMIGENKYGELLMEIRSQIQSGELGYDTDKFQPFEDSSLPPLAVYEGDYAPLADTYPYEFTVAGANFTSIQDMMDKFNRHTSKRLAEIRKQQVEFFKEGTESGASQSKIQKQWQEKVTALQEEGQPVTAQDFALLRLKFLETAIQDKFSHPNMLKLLNAVGRRPMRAHAGVLSSESIDVINEIRQTMFISSPTKKRKTKEVQLKPKIGVSEIFEFVRELEEEGQLDRLHISPVAPTVESDEELKLMEHIRVLKQYRDRYTMPLPLVAKGVKAHDYLDKGQVGLEEYGELEVLLDKTSKFNPRSVRKPRAPRRARRAR